MRFLFWNLNRKPLGDLVMALVDEHEPDVLALAECPNDVASWLTILNSGRIADFRFPQSYRDRVRVFVRFPRQYLTPAVESPHYSIRTLRVPGEDERLIAFVHLPSKLHLDADGQTDIATELKTDLERLEDHQGHNRSLIVGDLNMNPFEPGVAKAGALHAVNSRIEAARGSRIVNERRFRFFYNPMWSLLGTTQNRRIAGSYFYQSSERLAYFWNVFDQVLLRPDLLDAFDEGSLQILTSAKSTSFVTGQDRPNARDASDHLPIVFDLH